MKIYKSEVTITVCFTAKDGKEAAEKSKEYLLEEINYDPDLCFPEIKTTEVRSIEQCAPWKGRELIYGTDDDIMLKDALQESNHEKD